MSLFNLVTEQYPQVQAFILVLISSSDSIIVCYFSGFIARLTGDLTKAIEHFSRLEKHSALQVSRISGFSLTIKGSIQISTTAMYNMGYCSFLNSDWKLVVVYYEKFLNIPLEISKKRFRPYAGEF